MQRSEMFIRPEEWDKMNYIDKILCPAKKLNIIYVKRQEIIETLKMALLQCQTIPKSNGTYTQLQSIILKLENEQMGILKILRIKERVKCTH